MKKEQQHSFHKESLAVFLMVLWDFGEELLEEGIAYLLGRAFAILITRAISAVIIVFSTIWLKRVIFRLVKPIIKKITYKEGNDKMKALKKYWDKVMGNKITGTISGVGFAGISFFQTLIPFATHNWFIALAVFVVFYNIGIFFGGETLEQIQERLAQATLKKEQNSIIKEAKRRLAKLEKQEAQTETEKAKAEADKKAKAERDAKVEQAMAELKANKSE